MISYCAYIIRNIPTWVKGKSFHAYIIKLFPEDIQVGGLFND